MRSAYFTTFLATAIFIALGSVSSRTSADSPATAPASRPGVGVGKLPGIEFNVKTRQVRVECESLNVQMPLEFFCVQDGGPEHESVLRTSAKPSQIHLALLAIGLKPGEPYRYDEKTKQWFPPTGDGVQISCELESNGKKIVVPANRMMRSVKDHKEMPEVAWVFDGSRVLTSGDYAADFTSYVVSLVNFDMTMIDVPALTSNANETLEWECNSDLVPKKGTPVTMIIEPAAPGKVPPPKPSTSFNPGPGGNGG
jgi:hypothetical protein